MTNSGLFSTFYCFWPDLTRKTTVLQAKVSTDRSDETRDGPSPTLSFLFAQFHLSEHVLHNLAMNYRLIGLKTGSRLAPSLNVGA